MKESIKWVNGRFNACLPIFYKEKKWMIFESEDNVAISENEKRKNKMWKKTGVFRHFKRENR